MYKIVGFAARTFSISAGLEFGAMSWRWFLDRLPEFGDEQIGGVAAWARSLVSKMRTSTLVEWQFGDEQFRDEQIGDAQIEDEQFGDEQFGDEQIEDEQFGDLPIGGTYYFSFFQSSQGLIDFSTPRMFQIREPPRTGPPALDEDGIPFEPYQHGDLISQKEIDGACSAEQARYGQEKSCLTYRELMQVSKANVPSWKAVGDFCEWAFSMKFNDELRMVNMEKEFRVFHVDEVAEVASIAQLAAAITTSREVVNVMWGQRADSVPPWPLKRLVPFPTPYGGGGVIRQCDWAAVVNDRELNQSTREVALDAIQFDWAALVDDREFNQSTREALTPEVEAAPQWSRWQGRSWNNWQGWHGRGRDHWRGWDN